MGLFKKKSAVREDGATQEALRGLALRLALGDNSQNPNIVAFIAARSGEGTSTLALKYATLLTRETGKKVLLIDASLKAAKPYADELKGQTGIIDAALAGQPVETALHEIMPNLSAVRWVSQLQNRAVADRIMQNPDFWKRLQNDFAYIIIDAPSLQHSFDGVVLCARADTAIMVVEAEATPTPVTQKLRDTLMEAGAKLAGIVLTKRRFYIPQGVYNKM